MSERKPECTAVYGQEDNSSGINRFQSMKCFVQGSGIEHRSIFRSRYASKGQSSAGYPFLRRLPRLNFPWLALISISDFREHDALCENTQLATRRALQLIRSVCLSPFVLVFLFAIAARRRQCVVPKGN